MRRCRNCGKELEFGEDYCGFCGEPVETQTQTRRQRRSIGFPALIAVLSLLATFCIGACYLLLTRGPDPSKWFASAPATASPAADATAKPNAGGIPGAMLPGGLPEFLPDSLHTPDGQDAAGLPPAMFTPTLGLPLPTQEIPTQAPVVTSEPTATPVSATSTSSITATPKPTSKPTTTPKPTAKPTAAPAKKSFDFTDQQKQTLSALIQEGLDRHYTEDELKERTKDELSVLRNGMYALSGLKFKKNKALKEFFEDCDWYRPDTSDSEKAYGRFNDNQKKNVEAILKIERSEGYRKDNGALEALVLAGKERYFKDEELKGRTKYELSILRNGMYAMSGLEFKKNRELKDFFNGCDWYKPDTTDANAVFKRMNKYQTANVNKIVKLEKELGYR